MIIRNVRAELFVRYQRMVYSIAKKISVRFNRPYYEVVDEALGHLAGLCGHWLEKYDPKKGAQPQTWIYQCVYWSLWVHYDRESKAKRVELQEVEEREAPRSWAETVLSEVGDEGRALLTVLFEAPGEVAKVLWSVEPQKKVKVEGTVVPVEVKKPRMRTVHARRHGKKAITRYLKKELGWAEERVQRAWAEVEACVC